MSCYHPLLRVTNGSINMETGKEIGTVIPYIPVHERVPGTTIQRYHAVSVSVVGLIILNVGQTVWSWNLEIMSIHGLSR